MGTTRQRRLHGEPVVITRPAVTAGALVARLERLGGTPVRLPAMALLPVADAAGVTDALRAALAGGVAIFTSPAAVRFAARRLDLTQATRVMAPGHATARSLRRAGVVHVEVPRRHDSEGMLEHPLLRHPRGSSIALIGAAGGRGLLADTLRMRGARVHQVHVYRRAPPRITRRHVAALHALQPPFHVLLSSVHGLTCLRQALPPQSWHQLCRGIAVCSSVRVAEAADAAGFMQRRVAESAHGADLMRALVASLRTPCRDSS